MRAGKVYFKPRSPKVEISPGLRVWREFERRFEIPGVGHVTVAMEASEGRSRVTSVSVTESDERGVHGLSFAKFSLQQLTEQTLVAAVWLASGRDGSTVLRGMPRNAEVKATTRKRPVDPGRLGEVADAYHQGGTARVAADLHVTDRHARRLVSRARDAGLIDGGTDAQS